MNKLDNLISWVSPKWGAQRKAYRQALELQATYQGAYPSRVSTYWSQSESITGLPHLNLTVHRYLRDRARSLIENNPIASSILSRSVENIVGNGFQFQALTGDSEWNKQAEGLWNNWTHHGDFYGRSWHTHQKLVCSGLFRDGDIGSALLSNGQIQLVEADYISSPYTSPLAFLHDGIELDKYGRPASYSIMQFIDFKNRTWKSVPAKNFVFLANMRRATQYRGETFFAQTFDLFDQTKGYIDAVVLAQKIAACLAIFITKNDPTNDGVQALNYVKNAENQSQRSLNLEPGSIQFLRNGEGIEQINPAQPGASFDNNLRMLIRLLGLSFGLPLEYVLLDFSQVSGATAKASSLQAQRVFESIQKLMIDEYYSRIYRWRISKFINDGLIEERPDAFCHRFHAESWPYLDPVKEVQAQMLELDANLTTHTAQLLARGIDPAKHWEQKAAELAIQRKLNIPLLHSNYSIEFGTKDPTLKEETDSGQQNDITNNTNMVNPNGN